MSLINKHNERKIIILVCMCTILILIYEIIHIYAIFYSEVTGNVEMKNGKWVIEINGTEISKGIQKDFVIDQINIEQSEHVKNGKLAPGLSGNFEIQINPKNTDVSVKYEISLNEENLKNSSLKIKSISETEYNNELIRTEKNTYTAVIPVEKIKQNATNSVKIEVEWENQEENNEEDTKEGSKYQSVLQIPISVRVSQYLGEEIFPYLDT